MDEIMNEIAGGVSDGTLGWLILFICVVPVLAVLVCLDLRRPWNKKPTTPGGK